MKTVYVAGPYRGNNAWEVERNIRDAEECAYALMDSIPDLLAVVPHTMFRFFDGTQSGAFWIDRTLELMRRCDAVVLLPGWEKSAGTLGEIDEARRRGMPVFVPVESRTDDGNVVTWEGIAAWIGKELDA